MDKIAKYLIEEARKADLVKQDDEIIEGCRQTVKIYNALIKEGMERRDALDVIIAILLGK